MTAEMHKGGAYLLIQGRSFSPSRAESALGLDFGPLKNEPMALGTTGRFAGNPMPFGSAKLAE